MATEKMLARFKQFWDKDRAVTEEDENKDEESDNPAGIRVHSHTGDPTHAWDMLQVKQKVKVLSTAPPKDDISDHKVRFVCVSDTHNRTDRLQIPDGDVLLHAGDFTNTGQMYEVEKFNDWLGSLPHQHKVVIAGNHDLSFDDQMLAEYDTKFRFRIDTEQVEKHLEKRGLKKVKDILNNCTYLEDSGTQIYGIKIWGSPWQPEFGGWAFNLRRGQPCLDKWNMIPDDTDVLMTHGPPIGHGDLCTSGLRAGCVELLTTIQKRVKPKYHIFGHIHEGYGVTSDGYTTYLNASTCSHAYRPTQRPLVFDITLPEGLTKSQYIHDIQKPWQPNNATSNQDNDQSSNHSHDKDSNQGNDKDTTDDAHIDTETSEEQTDTLMEH